MYRIGIAGFGFMGQCHCRAYREVSKARVTAVFDSDPRTFEKPPTQGNIAAGELGDLKGAAKFTDFERFLADDLDVIDICAPTYLHRELTEMALRSGRAVICEKPMALSVADCDAMIEASRQCKRPLMVAQCVRFWPGYDVILEAVRSGKYGRCLSATFRRIGGAPAWSGWFLKASLSGGGILDCLVHDFDLARAAFGTPSEIAARGTADALGTGSGISYCRADLHYPVGPESVTIEGGWVIGQAFPFSMSAFVQFEQATLAFGIEPGAALAIYHQNGRKEVPALKPGQGYEWELRYFLDCLAANDSPGRCPPAESRDAIAMAVAARDSIAAGVPVPVG